MDREKIITVFKIFKVAYPNFYKDMTRDDAENTIALWLDMFKHENPELVIAAVKNLINTFKWPPTIADVKEEMFKLTNKEDETPIQLWNAIKKAISRSGYYAKEEFEKLPELAQTFVGSPSQLREWALSEDYNDSVVKGQFLKQVEILKQRKKDSTMMLPQVKELVKNMMIDDSTSKKLLS